MIAALVARRAGALDLWDWAGDGPRDISLGQAVFQSIGNQILKETVPRYGVRIPDLNERLFVDALPLGVLDKRAFDGLASFGGFVHQSSAVVKRGVILELLRSPRLLGLARCLLLLPHGLSRLDLIANRPAHAIDMGLYLLKPIGIVGPEIIKHGRMLVARNIQFGKGRDDRRLRSKNGFRGALLESCLCRLCVSDGGLAGLFDLRFLGGVSVD